MAGRGAWISRSSSSNSLDRLPYWAGRCCHRPLPFQGGGFPPSQNRWCPLTLSLGQVVECFARLRAVTSLGVAVEKSHRTMIALAGSSRKIRLRVSDHVEWLFTGVRVRHSVREQQCRQPRPSQGGGCRPDQCRWGPVSGPGGQGFCPTPGRRHSWRGG